MSKKEVASAYLETLMLGAEQGLLDLAVTGGSDVVFVREHRGPASAFVEGLEQVAASTGFACATFSVTAEHGFESLDVLVRAAAAHISAPLSADRGLLSLLDAFSRRNKSRALERFDEGCEAESLAGDLASLARSYLAAKDGERLEARNLKAFFSGGDVRRDDAVATSTLSPRTAKRTLVELTRLVRALGHRGTLLVVKKAGLLTELSPSKREAAYTVLRELVDNADGPRGCTACRIYVSGGDELFEGSRCLFENAPLATRVMPGSDEEPAASLLPHATLVHLEAPAEMEGLATRAPEEPGPRRARALRAIIRASHGLPPIEPVADLTVGYERIDQDLDRLFEHTENEGSVFSLLSGDYGTGKTHLLLHVTARALAERRPVLRLGVERLDTDLGNPQRHMRRLLEGALLPGPSIPTVFERLAAWCKNESAERRFLRTLSGLAEMEGEASSAAKRALRAHESGGFAGLEACLGAHDLESKTGNSTYRLDAYQRLLLWLELLDRLDECRGPVVMIDEAENLYRGGTSRPERRTALRSLAFYCGGTIPRACVIFAVTPETLAMLREEAESMLEDITEQRTVLPCEDVTMLRRRLLRARPMDVARLGRDDLQTLAERIRELHASARGATKAADWEAFLERILKGKPSPRAVVRATVQMLERAYWTR